MTEGKNVSRVEEITRENGGLDTQALIGQFAFRTELPEVEPLDLPAATEAYVTGQRMFELAQLIQGFAAACYSAERGQAACRQLASMVNDDVRTVQERREVYASLMQLNKSARSRVLEAIQNRRLRYTHLRDTFRLLERIEDQEFLLHAAMTNGYNVETFKRVIQNWKEAESEEERQRALAAQLEQAEEEEDEEEEVEEENEEPEPEPPKVELLDQEGNVVEVVIDENAPKEINRYIENQRKARIESLDEAYAEDLANVRQFYGDESTPTWLEISDDEWAEALAKAKATRVKDAGVIVNDLYEKIVPRMLKYTPGEATEAIVDMAHAEALIDNLRFAQGWLERVIAEAEEKGIGDVE